MKIKIERMESQLRQLTGELEQLKDELKTDAKKEIEYPAGFFVPELGENYWVIGGAGEIFKAKSDGHEVDEYRQNYGNSYKTEMQAMEAKSQKLAYGELVRLIAELNHREGWVVDFGAAEQNKGYVVHRHEKEFYLGNCQFGQSAKTELYFKPSLYLEIIKFFTEQKIKLALWGISE